MPSGELGPVGGNGHRPAHVQPGLTRVMVPAGGPKRRRRSEEEKRRNEGERKDEMEGDQWAFLAEGPISLDYKTVLFFKRALFFHSCGAGATVGG